MLRLVLRKADCDVADGGEPGATQKRKAPVRAEDYLRRRGRLKRTCRYGCVRLSKTRKKRLLTFAGAESLLGSFPVESAFTQEAEAGLE